MTIGRWISLVLAAAFCIYAALLQPPQLLVVALGYLVAPLAFIWFGDELGGCASRWRINKPTPGIFVKLIGWILLCLTPLAVHMVKTRSEWLTYVPPAAALGGCQ